MIIVYKILPEFERISDLSCPRVWRLKYRINHTREQDNIEYSIENITYWLNIFDIDYSHFIESTAKSNLFQ